MTSLIGLIGLIGLQIEGNLIAPDLEAIYKVSLV